MSLVLELVLQASNQLWYHLLTKGPNIEHNPLNHTHRNSLEILEEKRKQCKMSPILELVLQASSQLCYHLVTKGPNIGLSPLSHTHKNSLECWKKEDKSAK